MERRVRHDLLRTRLGRRLLATPLFPLAAQATLLAGLAFLAWNGWGVGRDASPEYVLTLRKTSLTTLVVWGLWWPGMIAVALFAGRAWCTVCPLELSARVGEGLARLLRWPAVRQGRVLRVGWLALAAYLALQAAVAGLSLHRVPHATALMLLVLAGGALLVGVAFRDARAFCRSFCPAAPLLSVYGRSSLVQLDVRDPSVCATCRTRECVREELRGRLDGRACPSRLAPYARQASDGCVLCLQCAKACPQGNVGLGLVDPEAPQRRRTLLRPAEVAFVLAAFGFVSHELMGEVPWLEGLFHVVPSWLAALVRAPVRGWETAWFLVLFPVAAWSTVIGVGFVVAPRQRLATAVLRAATTAAPLIALAHLAKAAAKVTGWMGYLPLALRDPKGAVTAARLAAGALPAPSSLVVVSHLGWAMVAVVGVASWRVGRSLPHDGNPAVASRLGLAVATAWFAGTFVAWGLS